ncbi:putative zinc ribbon domain protein [Anaerotignum neopropionicum]|uniref:Putative zinc ribbon domain protein n=1 Tax=Anaerotignum neopropionicum TaxID=36847 RepID=A0A136WB11_9FIRM|nr:zinc ribbon domain-containing protein [Anaerotignum neopropionicum]KXL51708.1 putative zinc ribbon domain protein [Anaerotignum neopropionicum]
MIKCIACGMPMNAKEDFACGDITKNYCKFCMREDGSMQSYREKLNSMTEFIIKTQGIKEQPAREAAKSMMAKLPAWQNKIDDM